MCYKQAGLMQDLRARLITGGFPEVEFRILNTESTVNDTSETLWRLRYAAGHPTIPVLQETPSNFLWHNLLDGAMDHILVLDRCSRLTYQVITPWSILHFPYVKAAILSTYEDDPCGAPCTQTLEQKTNTIATDDTNPTLDVSNTSAETAELPSSVESSEQTTDITDNLVIEEMKEATLAPLTERSDGTVPIRVVMHAPHMHRHVNGTVTQHEYLQLQTGNPDYHGHLPNDNNMLQQTHKRKKYKGHRRKTKLRPIQAETDENNNYEDTKLKHHRDKERPEKKKQKVKSEEQSAPEEAVATIEAPTISTIEAATTSTIEAATTSTIEAAGTSTIEAATTSTIEGATTSTIDGAATTSTIEGATTSTIDGAATEVNSEIPQEIQEHYDYRNMPYFSIQLHKPEMTVTTEATITSDYPPQEHIPSSTEACNTLEDNNNDTDLNLIDAEEHKTYKPNKAESQLTSNEDDDDESKKQVIEHYSKLLKWIHYSLPETRD